MNRDLPVHPVAVAIALTARAINHVGPMPTDEIAERAATAWHRGHHVEARADRRREAGTVAVVEEIYPLAFNAGRADSAAAIAAHITATATDAAAALHRNDPGGAVMRELLDRLTDAAANEARRSRDPSTGDRLPTPWPRSFLGASSGNTRDDAQRVATAATVAWNHGYEDGWTEGFWAANRIVNTVRHDEHAATTMIAGSPTITWLDTLAESAREISRDKPPGHPARLARLAGAEPAPDTDQNQPAAPAPHDTIDKHHRHQRGM
jgi:hypothetical protein